jgi:SAM-dependent methyltransferase
MAKSTHSGDPAKRGANFRRLHAAACERNREPIHDVLSRVLPDSGLVLEIGAGTGQHASYFAPRFPALVWQPSDPDPDMRASIIAWAKRTGSPNLRPPIELDVTAEPWPVAEAAAVISINMIHIAPWACCLALMAGAGRILPPRGVDGGTPHRDKKRRGMLYLYGPFKRDGRHTAPSNAQFDDYLRAQDPTWGVRDLDDVTKAAADCGLDFVETVEMPANNLSVVFEKRGR